MSGSSPLLNPPTIPALPNAIQNAQSLLAAIAAQTNQITDLNPGSIIRTISESQGAVIEEQGAEVAALVYQAIVYGAYSAFGISPFSGTAATGQFTFQTGPSGISLPPATQAVAIPSGSLVQTGGGLQFSTVSPATLASGATSVTVGIICNTIGTIGNVGASGISQVLTSFGYPLYGYNSAPTSGGSNSELPSQTAARFAAAVAIPGLASPLAVADAAIGVVASGTGEICYYSTCYENWIINPNTYGFALYIDNGTGSASSQLLSAVSAKINSAPQYRPAGVPWAVSAVGPVTSVVSLTGQLNSQYESQLAQISGAIASGITNYFGSLQFGQTAYQGQIAAAIGNSVPGALASIIVTLNSSLSALTAPASGRVILSTLSMALS